MSQTKTPPWERDVSTRTPIERVIVALRMWPGNVTLTDHAWAELAELRAERDHWKANYDEMVARNAILRNRPDLQRDKLTTENVVLHAEIERLKAEPRTCLVCGVIMHDPADEYLRRSKDG